MISTDEKVISTSACGRSSGILMSCSLSSQSMRSLSTLGVAPSGLISFSARSAAARRSSGTRPAANMPWRAREMSAAMSIPIGHTSVQRPHIVQAS